MGKTQLDQLAVSCGLQTEFWDWQGNLAETPSETIIAALAGLGIEASSESAIEAALTKIDEQPWQQPLPACCVTKVGQTKSIVVHLPVATIGQLIIELENGSRRAIKPSRDQAPERLSDGQLIRQVDFELPDDLPPGYHRLLLEDAVGPVASSTLIVSPACLDRPASLGDDRIWGYAVQLYAARSQDSWGVGDLFDLAELARWAAEYYQADYLLINPLHAAEPNPPMEPSPYLPTSRQFINPLYIRPEAIPEATSAADELAELRQQAWGQTDRIERDPAWAAKRQALRLVFDTGLSLSRQADFDAYRQTVGSDLHQFATWTVLTNQHGPDWRTWPTELRQSDSAAVKKFAQQSEIEITFVEWQQWIAKEQLDQAQAAARQAGMRIGIITDLAVGSSPKGADAWMLADTYASGIEVGAPPDAYNQLGQTWGQHPWRPDRLAEQAYLPFRRVVRQALSHGGGLRLDHIIGLFRLWWVPTGSSADKGCYVRYDHEALVGIIVLEAARVGGFIVGEDLGTVEPWVRDYLTGRGILGSVVLWFEETDDDQPIPPDQWPVQAMASVTTHDLPPTAGFLNFDHVHLRHDLGLLTEPLETELATARHGQQWWLDYVKSHGYLIDHSGVDQTEATVLALHRALVNSASQVLNVALTDAIGDRRSQNQPGTIDEYPNWRMPLSDPEGRPLLLEEIFASPRPLRLAAVMNQGR